MKANILTKFFSPYWCACIPLAVIIVIFWHTAAIAVDVNQSSSQEIIKGSINTLWVLIASILVIFMNAGFAMLETGFCRRKNAANILAKNLIVFAVSTIAYWAVGFSLMYGTEGNSIFGWGGWFLSSQDPATYSLKPFPEGLPITVFFLFQVAFAGTAATIVSGVVAERIKFAEFLIFSTVIVAIIYSSVGRWAWGGGWLGEMGFKDFAGSTVVHSVGGWSALTGAVILGPRLGKYRNGRIYAMPGHNMSIATLGCLILWIGWFGFNPGSVLAFNLKVPYIAVVTNLSAAAGGISATLTSWWKHGKPDLSMIINGILAGLVAVTAGCNNISYLSAIIIGTMAGFIIVNSISFFDAIEIDDPVGAISVHLVCGIFGTLAVGIFNQEAGLITGQFQLLIDQIIGIVAVALYSLIFSSLAWMLMKSTVGIRVSTQEEIGGLDVGEHGIESYSGFVIEADEFYSGVTSSHPANLANQPK